MKPQRSGAAYVAPSSVLAYPSVLRAGSLDTTNGIIDNVIATGRSRFATPIGACARNLVAFFVGGPSTCSFATLTNLEHRTFLAALRITYWQDFVFLTHTGNSTTHNWKKSNAVTAYRIPKFTLLG